MGLKSIDRCSFKINERERERKASEDEAEAAVVLSPTKEQ